jgi:response regulator RpfG family c-di-GMP phosphodiesterase
MAEQDKSFAVLYVDDEEKSLKLFRLLCQDQFWVLTASSAFEGLELVKKHKDEVDVILADRCMPKPAGIWLLQSVRESYPHIIRLLASDGCNRWQVDECPRDGTIQGIIDIPWEPAGLKKKLRAELDRFALQRGRES